MNQNLEFARHHFELALTFLSKNEIEQAEKELRKALRHCPSRPSILINLSAVLLRQQKWLEAKQICFNLLEIEPNNAEGIINLGVCKQRLDNLDDALDCFNKAVVIDPSSSSAWVNKANILLEQEKFDEARSCFETALNLEPESQESLIGIGNLYNEIKDYELGLKFFSKALEINPQNFQAQWNKSLSLLRLGQFDEGWKLYESRWHIPGMAEHARHQDIPLWLGKDSLLGKTILIHAEQGFGDAIQMSRYMPILINQLGAKVIFEVHPSLLDLMKTLDPKIQIINSHLTLENQIQKRPDFQCPVMSLPLAFKTTTSSIPNQIPYLNTNTELRQIWRERLNNLSKVQKPFRVGITWSGSSHYAGKKNNKRNISFDEVRQLLRPLEIYPIEFHAIQKEFSSDCIEEIPRNLLLHGHSLNTFADTASLISEMDLIVSIDTAVGHLSGALGKKTLLLIPDPPDFMAMIDIDNSPWYPGTKLIRQEHRGVWPTNKITKAILEATMTENN